MEAGGNIATMENSQAALNLYMTQQFHSMVYTLENKNIHPHKKTCT